MVLILEWYLYKVKLFKMKIFKKIISILITLIVMINFSSCAGTYKLEKSVRLTIGEVYYQNWVAGVQGGGAGFNIFIPVSDNPKNIMFDSVYFKGKKAKLEFSNNTIFIGRFKTTKNRIREINMINDSDDEFSEKTPFNLNDNECVVSYLDNDKIKYFKIENIIKKESILYQKTPSKKL